MGRLFACAVALDAESRDEPLVRVDSMQPQVNWDVTLRPSRCPKTRQVVIFSYVVALEYWR